MRAMRITEKNIEWIGMINDGVVPDPEHCLEEVHYFIDPENPEGHNEIIHLFDLEDGYEFVEEERENVLVKIGRKSVAPQITAFLEKMKRDERSDLYQRILEKGYSIEEVAAQAGLHVSVLFQIQNGTLRPSVEVRERLAKALGIDLSKGKFLNG